MRENGYCAAAEEQRRQLTEYGGQEPTWVLVHSLSA